MDHSIIELHYFLKKLFNYEEALYYKIKSLIFYKFKSNEELKKAVNLYTNKIDDFFWKFLKENKLIHPKIPN